MGTKKYLDAPVANKIFAEEVELPVITLCHINMSLRVDKYKYGLDYGDLKKGRFYPEADMEKFIFSQQAKNTKKKV